MGESPLVLLQQNADIHFYTQAARRQNLALGNPQRLRHYRGQPQHSSENMVCLSGFGQLATKLY